MKVLAITGLVVFILFLVVSGFLLTSWLIMLVWNILAAYFGFKTITFLIACLINIALAFVGGAFKVSINK